MTNSEILFVVGEGIIEFGYLPNKKTDVELASIVGRSWRNSSSNGDSIVGLNEAGAE